MRYLYFFLLIGLCVACAQDDPITPTTQEQPSLEKGLVVDVEFVSIDPCGGGGHGLSGIEMLLNRVITDGEAHTEFTKYTDKNGRVVFDPADSGSFVIRGEHDQGFEEMEINYEVGTLKRVTLQF